MKEKKLSIFNKKQISSEVSHENSNQKDILSCVHAKGIHIFLHSGPIT